MLWDTIKLALHAALLAVEYTMVRLSHATNHALRSVHYKGCCPPILGPLGGVGCLLLEVGIRLAGRALARWLEPYIVPDRYDPGKNCEGCEE